MPRKKKEPEYDALDTALQSDEEVGQETHWTAFIMPTIILLCVFIFVGAYIYVTRPSIDTSSQAAETPDTIHQENATSTGPMKTDEEIDVVYLVRDTDSSVIREVSGEVVDLGRYFVVDNYVYYRYNPGDSPYVLLIPIDADAEEFELVPDSHYFATHKDSVYFVRWSNPFEPTHNDFFVVEDADADTFALVAPESGNTHRSWLARDTDHVFYQQNIVPDADPATFTTTEHVSVNLDNDHVFLWNKILPGADPQTYEVLFDTSGAAPGTVFGQDIDHCYRDYAQIDCEMMPVSLEEARAIDE